MSDGRDKLPNHIGPTRKDQDLTGLPPGHGGADGDPDATSQDDTALTILLGWIFGAT